MTRHRLTPTPRTVLLNRRTLLKAMVSAGAGVLLVACGDNGLDPFAPLPTASDAPPPQSSSSQQSSQSSQSSPSGPQAEVSAQQGEPSAESSDESSDDRSAQAEVSTELPEPLVYIIPRPARQGDSVLLLVEAPGAQAASMSWQGQAFSLLKHDDRFVGFVGIDANEQIGPHALGVAVWGPSGEQLLWQETVIEISAVEWTVDDIQIDGPNAALLEPAIRAEDYAAREPFQSTLTPQLHWLGVFDPPSSGEITALYGEQRSFNGGPISEYHTGIDFGGLTGSSVTAANAGIVSWAGQTRRRGNGLIIDHGAGVYSGYYHLSELLQTPGVVVQQRDLIARMGATGLATGPHLHWEVVVRGVTVNPLPWLRLLEFPDPDRELNPANAIAATNLVRG